jgi:predicted dehydrogenase
MANLWRLPGLGLGYGDAFALQAAEFLSDVAHRRPSFPDFRDGLRACQVIDGILASAREGSWREVADAAPESVTQPRPAVDAAGA